MAILRICTTHSRPTPVLAISAPVGVPVGGVRLLVAASVRRRLRLLDMCTCVHIILHINSNSNSKGNSTSERAVELLDLVARTTRAALTSATATTTGEDGLLACALSMSAQAPQGGPQVLDNTAFDSLATEFQRAIDMAFPLETNATADEDVQRLKMLAALDTEEAQLSGDILTMVSGMESAGAAGDTTQMKLLASTLQDLQEKYTRIGSSQTALAKRYILSLDPAHSTFTALRFVGTPMADGKLLADYVGSSNNSKITVLID